MIYCAIGPLALEDKLSNMSHHMALAQYLRVPKYFDFYHTLIKEGKFVILDSGVYESDPVGDDELLYWCRKLKPSAVICPDVPHNYLETKERSYRFHTALGRVMRGSLPLRWRVLHAQPGDLEMFDLQYRQTLCLYDGICFSRLTQSYGHLGEPINSRPAYIRHLKEVGLWTPGVYHHALGMADGSVGEWLALRDLGVNSCDSSAPIWRGLHGWKLEKEKLKFGIDFDPFYMTVKNQSTIDYNLTIIS